MILMRSLDLKFLQLEETLYRSRTNSYSDKKKVEHFKELNALFFSLKDLNLNSLSQIDLGSISLILTYIENDIVFLNDSTLNNIPHELVYCLEKALEDWIDTDKIIISTTLTSKLDEFYFSSSYDQNFLKNLNRYIESIGIDCKISHLLLKMGLPKNCTRDYLANVVMYHELGHFIDSQYNISEKIYIKNFPNDYNLQNKIYDQRFNHISEYFADLFAAQYVSDASNLYLNFIANGNPDYVTHPATSKRINVVNDFLNDINNECVNQINEMLKLICNKSFEKRFQKISIKENCLIKLFPQYFKNTRELHYIFKLGWDFWENYESNILHNFNNKDRYYIVNNLIEKSISNYAITEQWSKEL